MLHVQGSPEPLELLYEAAKPEPRKQEAKTAGKPHEKMEAKITQVLKNKTMRPIEVVRVLGAKKGSVYSALERMYRDRVVSREKLGERNYISYSLTNGGGAVSELDAKVYLSSGKPASPQK